MVANEQIVALIDGVPPDCSVVAASPPNNVGSIGRELIQECACQPQNDTGNGARLLTYFRDELLHVRDVFSNMGKMSLATNSALSGVVMVNVSTAARCIHQRAARLGIEVVDGMLASKMLVVDPGK